MQTTVTRGASSTLRLSVHHDVQGLKTKDDGIGVLSNILSLGKGIIDEQHPIAFYERAFLLVVIQHHNTLENIFGNLSGSQTLLDILCMSCQQSDRNAFIDALIDKRNNVDIYLSITHKGIVKIKVDMLVVTRHRENVIKGPVNFTLGKLRKNVNVVIQHVEYREQRKVDAYRALKTHGPCNTGGNLQQAIFAGSISF